MIKELSSYEISILISEGLKFESIIIKTEGYKEIIYKTKNEIKIKHIIEKINTSSKKFDPIKTDYWIVEL